MKKQVEFLLCIATLGLVVSANANAEDYACVNIKGGSGFAASMLIESDYTSKNDWSGTFNVTETHCKSVKAIPVGGHYEVWIRPVFAESSPIRCSPRTSRSEGKGSTIWRASGNLESYSCKAPN